MVSFFVGIRAQHKCKFDLIFGYLFLVLLVVPLFCVMCMIECFVLFIKYKLGVHLDEFGQRKNNNPRYTMTW